MPANHARMLPEQVYLIHTASDAVLLARPLFLFGQRRVSVGAGRALLFPQGPERQKLKQNPAGRFFNNTTLES